MPLSKARFHRWFQDILVAMVAIWQAEGWCRAEMIREPTSASMMVDFSDLTMAGAASG